MSKDSLAKDGPAQVGILQGGYLEGFEVGGISGHAVAFVAMVRCDVRISDHLNKGLGIVDRLRFSTHSPDT